MMAISVRHVRLKCPSCLNMMESVKTPRDGLHVTCLGTVATQEPPGGGGFVTGDVSLGKGKAGSILAGQRFTTHHTHLALVDW